MGYKAWIGGKSAWVRTSFGVKRDFGKDVGTNNAGVDKNSGKNHEYIFLGMDGNYYSSPSKSEAQTAAGPGAVQISEETKKDVALIQELRKRKRKYNKG